MTTFKHNWRTRARKALVLSRAGIEIWEPVPEYGGMYEISNLGRIRSFKRSKAIFMKGLPGEYIRVVLAKGNVRKTYTVQELVLLTFVGPRPKGLLVLHTNDVKKDNVLHNLSYGSRKDNRLDRKKNGLENSSRGEKNGLSKLTADQVREIRLSTLSSRKLARKYKVASSTLLAAKHGKSWKHV